MVFQFVSVVIFLRSVTRRNSECLHDLYSQSTEQSGNIRCSETWVREMMLLMAVSAAYQSTQPPEHSVENTHLRTCNLHKIPVNHAALTISAHISVFCFYTLIFHFLQLFSKSDLQKVNY